MASKTLSSILNAISGILAGISIGVYVKEQDILMALYLLVWSLFIWGWSNKV